MDGTYKKVFNLAYRLAGNRSDAEDLTQEAYFRAYRSFSEYQGDKPFENWIFRIVTRLFLDLLRTRRRRIQSVSYDAPIARDGADDVLHFEVPDDAPSPEAMLMNSSLSEDLQLVLGSLSPEQQMLITLADIEQIPYKEIAEMLDRPVGTIRSRLHRAHKLMRSRLERLRECRKREGRCSQPWCCGSKLSASRS
jgi:RNA polymerase sigma-70 factor (ECF subfamily)